MINNEKDIIIEQSINNQMAANNIINRYLVFLEDQSAVKLLSTNEITERIEYHRHLIKKVYKKIALYKPFYLSIFILVAAMIYDGISIYEYVPVKPDWLSLSIMLVCPAVCIFTKSYSDRYHAVRKEQKKQIDALELELTLRELI